MTPKSAPRATAVAVLLAIALCVVGVILGRDALIEFGAVTDVAWIAPAIDSLMTATAQPWMVAAGIAGAVVGLLLVVLAVLPRRKTHRLTDTDGVWMGRRPGRPRISSIRRSTAAVDRFASVLVGAALVAVGAGLAAWRTDRLPDPVHSARRTVETWSPTDWADAGWWPWALTGAAVLTLVVGLRWLYAHRPRRQPASVVSENDEYARVDLASAARNAAAEFESSPGIASATGRVLELNSKRVIRVTGLADDSGIEPSELVTSAARLRETCASALAGIAVDVQVLIGPKAGK